MRLPVSQTDRGFTLLEVIVATFIMSLAICGLLSGLNSSIRNREQLLARERFAWNARHKLDELLASRQLRNFDTLSGSFPDGTIWKAQATPFDYERNPQTGAAAMQRIHLEVHASQVGIKSAEFDGYRPCTLTADDAVRLGGTNSK